MKHIKKLNLTVYLIFNLIIALTLSMSINSLNVVAQETTPPTITILSPTSTTYLTDTIELNFTVNEQTNWIGYSLDSAANVTIEGNTTLLGLTPGLHTLRLFAADAEQNTGQSSISFTILAPDTIPPTITILSPTATTYFIDSVELTFAINEPTSWIGYSLDLQVNTSINGGITLNWLADGLHTIAVFASDLSGNTGNSDQIQFQITTPTQDIAPPEITILSPQNRNYENSDILLDFSISEPVGWIGYSLDLENNITINDSITLYGLTDGPHIITLYATDSSGNTGMSNQIQFQIIISPEDTAQTTITILSPQNITYDTNSIYLEYKAENSNIECYSLDAAENVTLSSSILLTNLSDGEHHLTIYAQNINGELEASKIVVFEIQTKNILLSYLPVIIAGLWASFNFAIIYKSPKILIKN